MSRKFALIIGNTEYTDPGLSQLTAPGKDAEDFARVLLSNDLCGFDDVKISINETSASVIEKVDEFFDQKKPDDLLVLYFSGHGVKDEIGSLYLAFKNTIRSRLRSTAIKSDYIREAMDQSRSKRQVLILDCCNSGAFPQGTKAEIGGAMGMAKAFQGYGRFVLTASDATQFAWEGDKIIGETDNSLFTHFLVKGLEGEADNDGDGRITVDEIYDYVYQQISKVTPKQTPTKSSSKQEGEIILRENMRIQDIKPIPLPSPLLDSIENPFSDIRLGAVQQLTKLMNGKNLGLARSAKETLERVADSDDSRQVSRAAFQALETIRQAEQAETEERNAKEEAERLSILKEKEEQLAREKAEAERNAREEVEKLARAKAEKEAAEREAAHLKAEREKAELAVQQAAEKAAKEKAEIEVAEREAERIKTEQKVAREKAEREAAQRAESEAIKLAVRKKSEREAAEKAEQEAIELAARRKAEREAAEKNMITTSLKTASKRQPMLTWVIIGIVGLCIIGTGTGVISYLAKLGNVGDQNPTATNAQSGQEEVVTTPNSISPTPVVTNPDLVTPEPIIPLSSWQSFKMPHPILSDWRVRRALEYCTNRIDLIQSVYPLLTRSEQQSLVVNSFVPKEHWAYPGDENIFIYQYNPEKGKALLEEAGWDLPSGATYRINSSGSELAISLTTTTATFRQTWAAAWENQMMDCGIRITRNHVVASWWFGDTSGLIRRDFELGAFAWVAQTDPGGQNLYACDQILLPENGWAGQNFMGWCNPLANENIKKANSTLVKEERIAAYTVVQQEYTKDVPSIPLFNRAETFAAAADLTGFAPTPGQEIYMYNVGDWERPDKESIILGFSQEPASLFTLVENSFVAAAADYLIAPAFTTNLNYDVQSVYLNALPTIENGGTTNNDVVVKEGDKVVDATGNIVTVSAGTKVINSAGETVDFPAGGTVTMSQLVSKFDFINRIKWEDGISISAADFELAKKISCDIDSGAPSFFTCDKTANTEFTDTGYTQTWIPGVQDSLYFIPPWGLYPAHQVLADGRTLKDIPAKEWATLPEITEHPLSYGPYVLTEWVKGDRMIFESNPYWVFGTPKTKKIVIQFIAPENAESMLIGGEIDVLDSMTLVGLDQTLVDATDAGFIKTFVKPSPTWEHIDINLFINQ